MHHLQLSIECGYFILVCRYNRHHGHVCANTDSTCLYTEYFCIYRPVEVAGELLVPVLVATSLCFHRQLTVGTWLPAQNWVSYFL